MLYVAGGKTYLATYDEDLKVFPEVTVAVGTDGGYSITAKGGGVSKRPLGRETLTVEEYLARYGGTQPEATPAVDDDDEGPKLPTRAKK